MDNETILKLVNAGYSKAEIDAMGKEDESAGNENESAGNEGAGNEQTDANTENAGKVVEAGQHVDVNAALTALTDTVAGLAATVKAMQDGNINTAAGGKATDKVKEVMDSFIEKL